MINIKNKYIILLYFMLSLLFMFLFFRNYTQYLDVSLLDESGYLLLSRYHPIIYPGGYGALYILCYKILHQIITDDINLHYFAIIFLTWLPSFAVFSFLSIKRVPFLLSIYVSWLVLFSSYIAAFDWWPRISHFAISFILLYTAISYYFRFKIYKFLLFGILVCGILSFARPELMLSVYVLLMFIVAYFMCDKFIKKKKIQFNFSKWNKIIFSIMLLIFSLFYLVWKSPIKNTGRAYFALGQHYTFNVLRWENKDMTYFIRWPEIFEKQFGKSRTFKQMYKANPSETKRHIEENIKHYIEQTYHIISELIFPNFIVKVNPIYKYIIFIIIFLILLNRLGIQKYKNEIKSQLSDNFHYLLFFSIVALPSVLASFIIFPREHYFIMQLPLFVYIFYLLIKPFFTLSFSISKNIKLLVFSLSVLSMIAFTPHISEYPKYNKFSKYEKPNYVPYINYIKSLDIKDTVNFLTMEYLQIYLPINFARATEYFTKSPFYDSLVVAKKINMMYLSSAMQHEERHQKDSTFLYFINNYHNLGWQKFQLKDKDGYLIVKNEILKK
jgi:hypothetical protein